MGAGPRYFPKFGYFPVLNDTRLDRCVNIPGGPSSRRDLEIEKRYFTFVMKTITSNRISYKTNVQLLQTAVRSTVLTNSISRQNKSD